ncbi:MAG: hypothetical protein R6U84_09595 [Candidatus Cloacimonadales bacterium]
MKNSLRLLFAVVIIATFLLSACAPPPPPVSKDQLENAEISAMQAEEAAAELEAEMNQLEEKVETKNAELESLKKYQAELEAGN